MLGKDLIDEVRAVGSHTVRQTIYLGNHIFTEH